MTFSEATVKQAWQRAKGKCECERQGHGHGGGGPLKAARCNKTLAWGDRKRETAWGGWDAIPKDQGDGDHPSNCEIICWHCYKKTFGAHVPQSPPL